MTVRREEASKFAINSNSYTIDHSARQSLDKLADRGHRSFELMIYPISGPRTCLPPTARACVDTSRRAGSRSSRSTCRTST